MLAKEGCFLDMRAFIIMLAPQAVWAQSEIFNLIQIHFLHFVTLVIEMASLAEYALLLFRFSINSSDIGIPFGWLCRFLVIVQISA